ncbi:hypothetical protein J2852_004096 [Azospirillum soli]|nr:hypothetical protein [Azospirillum soli]
MKGTTRLILIAPVLVSIFIGSVQAASLPTSRLIPVPTYKGPTRICTLVQTSAGWYNPCTGATIPFFG